MDTLIIVFDKTHRKQTEFERVHYDKSEVSNDRVPVYKSRLFRLENKRKVIRNRIVDTINFGGFTVLNPQLFEKEEKPKILIELEKLQKELVSISDRNTEEAIEVLKRIEIATIIFDNPSPLEIPKDYFQSTKFNNVFFLSNIVSHEDFFRFEDQIKGKVLYLVEKEFIGNERFLAHRVFYTKMSPDFVAE